MTSNVLGTQRVNRAALPHMRAAKQGLLVWVSSSSSAGGTPPYLSPYFAAKAAMDALAVQYARELARWGIETSIVVPGAFTKGTNHFAHSGRPADEARLAAYEAGPYHGFGEQVQKAFAEIVPDDADVAGVADGIVEIVDMPFGTRPSASTMIRPRTAPMSASWCLIACAPRCCTGSGCPTCSSPQRWSERFSHPHREGPAMRAGPARQPAPQRCAGTMTSPSL